jgi:hypothetical protein
MMLKRNTFIGCFARAISRPQDRSRVSLLLLSLVALFVFVEKSHAQAIPTADKNGGIDAVGTFTFTSPDYPCCNVHDYPASNDAGVTVGADYLLKRFVWGQPAIAVRYSFVTGSTVNETFAGGGMELHYRYHLFMPYFTALGGVGSLSLPATGYKDSGNTYVVGAGTDYPLAPRFSARGEFTYSFVDITGFQGTLAGAKDMHPWSINLGVVYHIK